MIAHIIVPILMNKFIRKLLIVNNNSTFRMNIPRKMGNMQYPKIDTAWKYEISPPNTRTLKLITDAPNKHPKNKIKNWVES